MAEKSKKEKKKIPWFVSKGNCDYQILFLSVALMLFGLLMVYSSSSYRAVISGKPAYTIVKSQIRAAALGLVAMLILSKMNYRKYQSFGMIAMLGVIALCAIVLVIGKASGGAVRWIAIGPIQIQPSELAKPAIMIFIAGLCSDHPKWLRDPYSMYFMMLLPLIAAVLIMTENLSTAIICIVITLGMIIVASPNWVELFKTKLFLLVLLCLPAVFAWAFTGKNSYRWVRILAWLHPEKYPDDTFQTLQSMYAIGSGGLFGRGLGQSIQKTGNLPESHNDMIFAIICEELGLVGGLILITAFVLLILRLMHVMKNTQDVFGGLIMVGLMIQIGVQVLINIGVVTGLIPNTGVTLPFVSFGGTSLIVTMCEMGMALSISRQQRFEEERL